MKRFSALTVLVLVALISGAANASASSTRFVFWNTRGARNCSAPGVCAGGHNHAITPHLFSTIAASPDLIGLGVVEFCKVDYDNIVSFYGSGTAKNMFSLPYVENGLSGSCKIPTDPNHAHNQWFGNAEFSIGTPTYWETGAYTAQSPGEDQRGYVCMQMTIFVVAMYECTTHLAANDDGYATQQLGGITTREYARTSPAGPLPLIMMDANLHTTQSSWFNDVYQGGAGFTESSMSDVAGYAPCPGGVTWYLTCQTASFNSGEKIDYIWIPDALAPVRGVTDSSTWSPLENDSDHSVLLGKW